MHLVYLQNLCITIVFDFSWGNYNTQENLETMVTPFFWGGGGYKVRYGLRENNEYQSHITVVSKLQECVSVLKVIKIKTRYVRE